MGIKFSADEVFEMADRIEKNGVKYYRRAAEIFKDEISRDIFADMASMEEEHQRIFAIMRSELTPAEKENVTFDPDNLNDDFLHVMADGYVFDLKSDPSNQIGGRESPEQIIKYAIGMEKDSIIFYLGIKSFVPEHLGGKRIKDIIKEEMGHIAILNKELGSLKNNKIVR